MSCRLFCEPCEIYLVVKEQRVPSEPSHTDRPRAQDLQYVLYRMLALPLPSGCGSPRSNPHPLTQPGSFFPAIIPLPLGPGRR